MYDFISVKIMPSNELHKYRIKVSVRDALYSLLKVNNRNTRTRCEIC